MEIEKITKRITLPVAILLSAIVLAISFYIVQYNKQQSIERQQEAKAEQEYREYVAKRKMECYELYKERDEIRNNVEGYRYIETTDNFFLDNDTCEIIYKNSETGEYFRKYY